MKTSNEKKPKEKKKEIWSEIENTINQIKTNSKDAKFADKLIDKLLSLKGQYDVEPTRLYVAEKEVIKEYDNDSLRIVRCKSRNIWELKRGIEIHIKPTARALYEFLEGLCIMKDKYDELTEQEKLNYNYSYYSLSLMFAAPSYAMIDDKAFNDLSEFLQEWTQGVINRNLNQPLQEETPIENAEFETKMVVANELLKEDAGSK